MPTTVAVRRVLSDGPATASDIAAETGCTVHQALGMLHALKRLGDVVPLDFVIIENARGASVRSRLWRLAAE